MRRTSTPLASSASSRRSSSRAPAPRSAPGRTRLAGFALLVLLALLPLAHGCAAIGLGGFNVISIEEEWELGRQIEAELAQELPLSSDAVVTGYIRQLGRSIVAQTPMANLEWRFHVVESEDINAFNAPGGLVYVNTGLITEAGDVSELIAVIGHEVGHGVARHGTQRISQQYGLAVLAGVVLGQDPGVLREIVASIVAAGAMAQFSQQDEFEADDMGIRFTADAGFHPDGMVRFLERLLALRDSRPGTVERIFASHPPTRARIERGEARIAAMGSLDGLTRTDGELAGVKGRIR